jgi:hypothetical protein
LANHSSARARNSAFSGFRKSVSLFWNTQTLERVHLKWRQTTNRSLSGHPAASTEGLSSSLSINNSLQMYTNRLPSAWRRNSLSSGKTTVVWLSVLFFLL